MSFRTRVVSVGLVAVLAACGGSSDTAGSTTSSTEATAPGSTSTGPVNATTVTTAAAGTTIDVVVAHGEPEGGVHRVKVTRGDQVTLRVDADIDDEVHVHGYDLHGDVAPGHRATIEFTADLPGQFEIEIEGAGFVIVELTVD